MDHLIGQSPTQQKRQREEAELALKTETEKRMAAQAAQAAADREADNKRADATAAEAARHNKAMEARPVAGAQPSFQAKEVIGDDGKPTMANFDSRSGGYTETATGKPILHPKPVPSAMEQMDSRKFEKAGPILSSIEELSEKINTQAGLLAKMAGGAAKVQAKSNYNDDVAEYQALVSGFTPLVARSLGHTGVLTQQDVDSVKELFPKPGDSKTLRDRKISRIKTIIGQLEAIEGSGGAPPQAPKAGDGGGWTIVGGVRIREKP